VTDGADVPLSIIEIDAVGALVRELLGT